MQIDLSSLDLNRIGAQVMKPLPNRDTPLEVHPSFPFLIHVEGVIHHVSDTTGIAVQVSFPQNIVRQYYPPPDHFTLVDNDVSSDTSSQTLGARSRKEYGHQGAPSNSRTYRLRTSIEVYPDAAWGYTAAELRITLTRSFQPDLVGHDEFICRFAQEVVVNKRQRMEGGGESASRLPQQPRLNDMSARVVAADHRTSSTFTEQNQSTLEISKSAVYYISRQRTYSQ